MTPHRARSIYPTEEVEKVVKLQILNPQASTMIESVGAAPRVGDLPGKSIGLWWNMKAGGDVALERTVQLLTERFPGIQFKHYTGSIGALMRHATAEDADRIARECDAVIGTTSD